jgi:hypothetical protein
MYKKNIKIIMKLKGSMSHLRGKIDIEYVKIVLLIQLTMDLKLKLPEILMIPLIMI